MYLLDIDKQFSPSSWVRLHASKIAQNGLVLDLAAGTGRNAKWLAEQGFQVEAVDVNAVALSEMADIHGLHCLVADVENAAWPYQDDQFDGIVVCRYLHRPLFPEIKRSLKSGGVLVYETFMRGQEAYGRPTNPDFLLESGELKRLFETGYRTVAFEEGLLESTPQAMIQRICVIKA